MFAFGISLHHAPVLGVELLLFCLLKTSPPATKKTNDSDSRSDGSGYEEIEDEDSDGSGYEDLDDNKNGEEGEMYEGVDSDVISKLLTPHPASSPGMSTRNDSGISGISRDRGTVCRMGWL